MPDHGAARGSGVSVCPALPWRRTQICGLTRNRGAEKSIGAGECIAVGDGFPFPAPLSAKRMILELRSFLSALLRGWVILLIAIVLGLGAAVGHVMTANPTYQSTARLYVNVVSASNIGDLAQANALSQQIAANYAELAVTPYVLRRAATKSGLPVSAASLASSVTAVVTANTAFINITATSTTPQTAATVAESVSQSLIVVASGLSAQSSSKGASLRLTEVQPASVPDMPSVGSLRSELPLGALIGLIVGSAVVILRERLSGRFQSGSHIATVTDSEIVGMLPTDRRARRGRALALPKRSPLRFEALRSVRTAIQGLGLLSEHGSTIAVTSSVPGEGKSSTVAGLAVAIAASGRTVVVVEGDLRRPRVGRMFDLPAGPGLTEMLAGQNTLAEVLQVTADPRISVLRSGSLCDRADELIESAALEPLLSDLTADGAIVLLDTPPLLALSDAASIARRADHVLLVAGAPVVHERDVIRALAVLRQVQVQVAGVVVNRVPRLWADSTVRAYSGYATAGRGRR